MTVALESKKKTYTLEQFMALPDNGKKYELVDGELVEMQGPSGDHARVVRKLIKFLERYLDPNPLGETFPGAAFVLDPATRKNARLPDVGFVSAERLVGLDLSSAIPVPPDLAIEVISSSERVDKIQDKIEAYQRAGVRLIWSIYLPGRYVHIHRLGDPNIRLLNLIDELDGEDLIPGFRLPVRTLFE